MIKKGGCETPVLQVWTTRWHKRQSTNLNSLHFCYTAVIHHVGRFSDTVKYSGTKCSTEEMVCTKKSSHAIKE